MSVFRVPRLPDYAWVAISSWVARAVMAVTSILSIRILLETLGVEGYAAYAVLVSLVGWLMLADFGVGQGLQNYISSCRTDGRPYQKVVRDSALFTVMAAVVLGAILITFSEPLAALLLHNFQFPTEAEKREAYSALVLFSIAAAIGSLIFRIWYAEHIGYMANLVNSLAAISSLSLIYFISISSVNNKLLWCVVATSFPLAVLSVVLLCLRLANDTRFQKEASLNVNADIIRNGRRFLVFNVIAASVFQVDILILAQFSSAPEVTTYSVTAKIYSLMGFIYGAVLQAFWPRSSEAVHAGDWGSIRKFVISYLIWSSAFILLVSAFVALLNEEASRLFGLTEEAAVPRSILLLFLILYLLRAWTDVFAVILQSANEMQTLTRWAALQAIIGLLLHMILVPKFGMHGSAIALIGSWVCTVAWVLPKQVIKISAGRIRLFPVGIR